MIISHKYRFIFVKTAKTAGTSIEIFLFQNCGEDDILTPIYPPEKLHVARNYRGIWNPLPELFLAKGQYVKSTLWHFLRGEKFYNHIPALLIKRRVSKSIWDRYYKFCVERNPWDMALSHYSMLKYRSRGHLTFDKYIDKKKYRSNYNLYTDTTGQLMLDKVAKYENLLNELGEIFEHLGIPFTGTLGVRAKSEYRNEYRKYKEIYSSRQRQIIEKAFEKEIRMHGYSFEEE